MIRRFIDRHGEQTNGIIKYMNEIPRPDQLGLDEWVRKKYAIH